MVVCLAIVIMAIAPAHAAADGQTIHVRGTPQLSEPTADYPTESVKFVITLTTAEASWVLVQTPWGVRYIVISDWNTYVATQGTTATQIATATQGTTATQIATATEAPATTCGYSADFLTTVAQNNPDAGIQIPSGITVRGPSIVQLDTVNVVIVHQNAQYVSIRGSVYWRYTSEDCLKLQIQFFPGKKFTNVN